MVADALAPAWRPRLASVPATAEIIVRFRAAIAARDIVAPERIIADGSIHRCDAAGKNGKGDAAYLLHLHGIPAGGLENWRDGKGWEAMTPRTMSAYGTGARPVPRYVALACKGWEMEHGKRT